MSTPSISFVHPVWFTIGYSLKMHNTFQFDVYAHLACKIETEAQLIAALSDRRAQGMRIFVLGGGSNVVLTGDCEGLVLLIALHGRRLVREDHDAWYVQAASGENWHDFVAWTLAQGMPGLENLALIPGTVGAAPVQNIGAYGLEMCERFESLRAIELTSGKIREFDVFACRFGYRDSFFKREGRERFVITSVIFKLPKMWMRHTAYTDITHELAAQEKNYLPDAQMIFDAVVAVRRAKLPDPCKVSNAGSFFKNPIIDAMLFEALRQREPKIVAYPQVDGRVKLAAGSLIDHCGWKGRAIGPAAVDDRHALILVNPGTATGHDVLALAQRIQLDVMQRFGVALELEPIVF